MRSFLASLALSGVLAASAPAQMLDVDAWPPASVAEVRGAVEADLSGRAEGEANAELFESGRLLLEELGALDELRAEAAALEASAAAQEARRAAAQAVLDAPLPEPSTIDDPTPEQLLAAESELAAARRSVDELRERILGLEAERLGELQDRRTSAEARRADAAAAVAAAEVEVTRLEEAGASERELLTARWTRDARSVERRALEERIELLDRRAAWLEPEISTLEREADAAARVVSRLQLEVDALRAAESAVLQEEARAAERDRLEAEALAESADTAAERRLQAWLATTYGFQEQARRSEAERTLLRGETPVRDALADSVARFDQLTERYTTARAAGVSPNPIVTRGLERVRRERLTYLRSSDADSWRRRRVEIAAATIELDEARYDLNEQWELEVEAARAEWLEADPAGAERFEREELPRWEDARRIRRAAVQELGVTLGDLHDLYLRRLGNLAALRDELGREERWLELRGITIRRPFPDPRAAVSRAFSDVDEVAAALDLRSFTALLLVSLVGLYAIALPLRRVLRRAARRLDEARRSPERPRSARGAWLRLASRVPWILVPLAAAAIVTASMDADRVDAREAVRAAGRYASAALGVHALALAVLELANDAGAAARVRRYAFGGLVAVLALGVPHRILVELRYDGANPDLVALLGRGMRAWVGVCALLLVSNVERLLDLVPEGARARTSSAARGLRGIVFAGVLTGVGLDLYGYESLGARILFGVLGLSGTGVLGVATARSALHAWSRTSLARGSRSGLAGRRRQFLYARGREGIVVATSVLALQGALLSLGIDRAELRDLLAVGVWPPGGVDGVGGALKLGQLVALLLTLVGTYFVANLLRGALDHFLLAWVGVDRSLRYSLSSIVHYLAFCVGLLLALSSTGIAMSDLQWFLAAAGVGIGFGLQEIVSNFVSGLIILFERPIKVGDVILLDTLEGEVAEVSIRATTIRTWKNEFLTVPNKELITQRVNNMTGDDPRVRLDLPVGVAYGSDLKLVRQVLLDVAGRHGKVLDEPPPNVVFVAHGESSLDFELRVWVHIDHRLDVRHDVRMAVDAAFRRAGIEIPFPQRDVHLHTTPAEPTAESEA